MSRWEESSNTSSVRARRSLLPKAFRRMSDATNNSTTSKKSNGAHFLSIKRKTKRSSMQLQKELTNIMLILITKDAKENEILMMEIDLNTHKKSTVGDLLLQIPATATNEHIKNQGYYCICSRDGTILKNTYFLSDYFGKNTRSEFHEVGIPVPFGAKSEDVMKLIQPLLADEQIVALTGVDKDEDLNNNKSAVKVHNKQNNNFSSRDNRISFISEITQDSFLENIPEVENELEESADLETHLDTDKKEKQNDDSNKFDDNVSAMITTKTINDHDVSADTVETTTESIVTPDNVFAPTATSTTTGANAEPAFDDFAVVTAAAVAAGATNKRDNDDGYDMDKNSNEIYKNKASPGTTDKENMNSSSPSSENTTTNATATEPVEGSFAAAIAPTAAVAATASALSAINEDDDKDKDDDIDYNKKSLFTIDEENVNSSSLSAEVIDAGILAAVSNMTNNDSEKINDIEDNDSFKSSFTISSSVSINDTSTSNIPLNNSNVTEDAKDVKDALANTATASMSMPAATADNDTNASNDATKDVQGDKDVLAATAIANVIMDNATVDDDNDNNNDDNNNNVLIYDILIDSLKHQEEEIYNNNDVTIDNNKIFQIIVVTLSEGTVCFELIEFDVQISDQNDNLTILNLLYQIPLVVKNLILKRTMYKCLCTGNGMEIDNHCNIMDCFDNAQNNIFCAIAVPTHMTCMHCATIVKPFFSDYDIISMVLDSKEHNGNFDDIHNIAKIDNDVDCQTVMTNQISELTTDLLLPPTQPQQHQQQHAIPNAYANDIDEKHQDNNLLVVNSQNNNKEENDKEEDDEENLNSLEIIAMLVISLLYYAWNEVTSGNIKRKSRGLFVISIFICMCYWNKRIIIADDF